MATHTLESLVNRFNADVPAAWSSYLQPVLKPTPSLAAIVARCEGSPDTSVYFRFGIAVDGSVYASEVRPNADTEAYTVESEPWQREDPSKEDTQLPRKITVDALLLACYAFAGVYADVPAAMIGIQPLRGSFVIRVLGVIPKPEPGERFKRDTVV